MTISDDDEKQAREWLSAATATYSGCGDAKHRATILALLDRPTMPGPDEVPDDVLEEMHRAWLASRLGDDALDFRAAIKVLHDWRTKPAEPRKVEAWAVLWPAAGTMTLCDSKEKAEISHKQIGGSRIVHLREVESTDD